MPVRSARVAVLLGVLSASWAGAQVWLERGDAPSHPDGVAQVTQGEGPLSVIVGVTSFGDPRDAYCLKIADPEAFVATTDPAVDSSAGASFDTRLFLFRVDESAVLANDDTPPGGAPHLSTLTGTATDGSGYALTRPGEYVLVIGGEEEVPRDDGDLELFLLLPADVVAAANPAAGSFDHWLSGASSSGEYAIALTGVAYCQTAVDAVFANYGVDRVCLGDGEGAFSPCAEVSGDADFGRATALGFVDGNDTLDAVVANYGVANRICLGDRRGGFGSCLEVSADENVTRELALGLIDGDEYPDVVFANSGANRVCLGDGAGRFAACSDVEPAEDFTRGVALGFVDGDTNLDAVFANNGTPSRVCLGDGLGGFACAEVGADMFNSGGVGLGRMDGDRHLDVVFANSGPNRVCFGDGDGGFSSCSNVSGDTDETWGMALGRIDGDSHLDAAFANYGSANRICFGDGSGGFTCADVGTDADPTREVAVGLIDGDASPDLVFANPGRNRVCLGDGAGGFSCADVGPESEDTYGVALGELGTPLLFADGFESGDTSAWSRTVE